MEGPGPYNLQPVAWKDSGPYTQVWKDRCGRGGGATPGCGRTGALHPGVEGSGPYTLVWKDRGAYNPAWKDGALHPGVEGPGGGGGLHLGVEGPGEPTPWTRGPTPWCGRTGGLQPGVEGQGGPTPGCGRMVGPTTLVWKDGGT